MDCGPDQTAGSRNWEKPTEARGAVGGPGCCERGSMQTSAISIILTSQRVGPGSQEWDSIQISQVHSTLVVQRAGPGGPREVRHTNLCSAHKPHGAENGSREPRQVHASHSHRGWAWGAETSAGKICNAEGRPGKPRQGHTSPVTQKAAPVSWNKCTQAPCHRGRAQGAERSLHKCLWCRGHSWGAEKRSTQAPN